MIKSKDIENLINFFSSISLDEMDKVSLLNRMDTKYVVSVRDLILFLESVKNTHRILNINDARTQNYKTFYYDTSDLKMYVAHHNKKANRFKIRTRQYIESNLFFLEIKNKSNKGKTVKKRIKLKESAIKNNPKAHNFILDKSPYNPSDLSPVLGNTFRRITLVDNDLTERLTIDIDLLAWDVNDNKNRVIFPEIAIIELKRDAKSVADTHKKLQDLRIKSMGFSKYAITSSYLFSNKVKSNNFKKKHRSVGKIATSL